MAAYLLCLAIGNLFSTLSLFLYLEAFAFMEHFLHSYRSQTHNALEQEFTGKEKEQENRARGAPISGVDGKRRQGKECRKHQVSKV